MDSFSPFSLDLARALQGLGAWLTMPMQFFTFLGNEVFLSLIHI